MSRVARIVAGVVIVAAAVIAAPFTAGTSLAFLPAAFGAFGASLVLGASLEAISGRPQLPGSQRQGISGNVRGTTEAHNIVFGRARTGGVLQSLGTTGADNQFVWFALAHSITHPGGADRIGRIWVDEFEVLESQITATSATDTLGQPMTHYDVTAGRFAGLVRLTFRRGTSVQGADGNLSGIGGVATDYARGVAISTVRLFRDVNDEDAFQEAFQGRIPVISVELYGMRVYDPRLDSTAGGSGAQRVAAPSTWAFSENAALCAATYSIMSQSDGGEGLLPADIDWFSVAAAANVCDQVPMGGGLTYRVSALLTTSSDRRDNTSMLLDAMQGARVEVGTMYTFFAGAWRIPSFTIDDTWLRSAPSISPRTRLSAAFNQVRISTQDNAQAYQKIEVPPYVNPTFETQDGSRRLVRDVNFPTCADVNQAQRMGAIIGRKSRRQMTIELGLNWRGMTLETWETGTISLPGRNFAGRTFRIISMTLTEDGPNATLQEDSASDYGDIMPQAVPAYSPPDIVFAVPAAPYSLSASGGANGIDLRWSVVQAYRDAAIAVYRKPGNPGDAGSYTLRDITFGTNWRDSDLTGSTFSYRVRVQLRNGQQSPDSNTASAAAFVVADGADNSADQIGAIVRNPGFEAGAARWTLADGGSGGILAIVNDPANARSGNWCLRKTGNAGVPNGLAFQTEPYQCTPGAVLVAAMWFKSTSGASGNGAVGVTIRNAAGADISSSQGNLVSASTAYLQSRLVLSLPDTAASVVFYANFTGTTAGDWYADDASAIETLRSIDEVPDGSMYGRRIRFEAADNYLPNGLPNVGEPGATAPGWLNGTVVLGSNPLGTAGQRLLQISDVSNSTPLRSEIRGAVPNTRYVLEGYIRVTAGNPNSWRITIDDSVTGGYATAAPEETLLVPGSLNVWAPFSFQTGPALLDRHLARFYLSNTSATPGTAQFYGLIWRPIKNLDRDVEDGPIFGRPRQTALTDGMIDFAKTGFMNKTADNVAESSARKWAGETGATVGARWGENLVNQPQSAANLLNKGSFADLQLGRWQGVNATTNLQMEAWGGSLRVEQRDNVENAPFTVVPGERIFLQGRIFNGADPTYDASFGLVFFNAAGTAFDFVFPLTVSVKSVWTQVFGSLVVPSTAVRASGYALIGGPGGTFLGYCYFAELIATRHELGAEQTTGKAIDILADGTVYARTRVEALTGGMVDLSKVGVIGKNLDNITDSITFARILNTELSSGIHRLSIAGSRTLPARNVPAVRQAGVGSLWSGLTMSATWDSATPANVTLSASAATLNGGSFASSFTASSVVVSQARGSTVSWRLYYDNSQVLGGGTFALQATTSDLDLVGGGNRAYLGRISVTVPGAGGGSGGTPVPGGGGQIP